MTGRVFQRGEFLYQEGDRSDHVYLVVDGSVEILKSISDKTEVVGMAGPGDFVGEIASLIDRNRTTSARITKDGTRIKRLKKSQFLRLSSQDPEIAYNLLTRLCERLHASSRRGSDDAVLQVMRTLESHNDSFDMPSSVAETTPEPRLTIFPETDFLAKQMPTDGISLISTPFIVGRKPDSDEMHKKKPDQWLSPRRDRRSQEERRETNGLSQVNLQLTDVQPYRLSRIHFLFQKMPDGRFITRDLGSTLGTRINESFLGTHFPSDFCELNIGENIISAGGSDTPFKFRAIVESE